MQERDERKEKSEKSATDEALRLRLPVSPVKQKALEARMQVLGIRQQDIEEKFIKGSGSGGQKINKTSSCVQLKHTPSGVMVRCQEERSQSLNRYKALVRLCDAIEAKQRGFVEKKKAEAEKIRRQKRRRSRRAREKEVEGKRGHGERKAMRRKKISEKD